jgi:uncharacterized membrane protein YphA (DoxX/SURF4 family)
MRDDIVLLVSRLLLAWIFLHEGVRQFWRTAEPNVVEPTHAIVQAVGILERHEPSAFLPSSLHCLAN